jgi:hypothetical protein
MKRESDEGLDALLGEGRMSGPARDRILDAVLARPARPLWQRVVMWVLPLSTAAALVFLMVRPSEFQARGGGGPVLEAACAVEPCRAGATVLFRAGGADAGGFLAAFAIPEGVGERIWYFPSLDGECPQVEPSSETQTLPRGVRLGPEQPPGRYRVHLLLSRRPLTRAEALAPPSGVILAETETLLEVAP